VSLNSFQHAAVRFLDGPLLVLAGAGSGKTRLITHKITHLIKNCGIAPSHIAAVTFTNKAAREMQARVAALLGARKTDGLRVSTFHSLGLTILRREAAALGYRPNISILDSDDTATLLRDLLRKELGDDSRVAGAQWQISEWKSALIDPAQATASAADAELQLAAGLYEQYQHHLKAYNAVDFDDLIALPVQLFCRQPGILEAWQNRIRYLLVDEYQDTNAGQYQLVRQLVGVRGALTAVGDDDQSIYAWRGARPENLALLQQDFPTLQVIKLEQNYRSTGRIVKAANHLIANNPHAFPKKLWSELGYGDPIRVIETRSEEHEAETVVSEILSHKFKHRTGFRDYAILYRGNHQARLFEKSLREQRVPYYLSGGTSFFSQVEVKDLMAYLRLLVNPDDDAAFLRVVNVPRRELGPSTLEKLGAYAGERGVSLFAACFELGLKSRLPERAAARLEEFVRWLTELGDRGRRGDPLAAVRDLVQGSDYERWVRDNSRDEKSAQRGLANLRDLVSWMQRLAERTTEDRTLPDLVAHMSLMDLLDRDHDDRQADCVSLLTLHAAKGLEFPHVFLTGMEESLLPHRTSIEAGAIEEERRLAYVGITRARQTLTFTYAAKRKRGTELAAREPSRFLAELPAEDLHWQGGGRQSDPVQRQERGQAHLANLRGLLQPP